MLGECSASIHVLTSLDVNHLNHGPGKVTQLTCNEGKTIFRFYIFFDLIKTPYIAMTCHGVHSHAPPPPGKQPIDVVDKLVVVVRKIGSKRIKLGKLIYLWIYGEHSLTVLASIYANDHFQNWISELGGRTLMDIHLSFVNQDALKYILRKERLLHNPFSSARIAMAFEWQKV